MPGIPEINVLDEEMNDVSQDQPIFPINRIVAFLGPLFAVIAGYVATWLLTNVELLAVLNIDHNEVVKTVTELLVFAVTAGLTWLGQRRWLIGWQNWEAGVLKVQAAAVAGSPVAPSVPITDHPEGNEYDEEAANAELQKKIDSGEVPQPDRPF